MEGRIEETIHNMDNVKGGRPLTKLDGVKIAVFLVCLITIVVGFVLVMALVVNSENYVINDSTGGMNPVIYNPRGQIIYSREFP